MAAFKDRYELDDYWSSLECVFEIARNRPRMPKEAVLATSRRLIAEYRIKRQQEEDNDD